MNKRTRDFDIGQISRSGQCFRLHQREDESYSLIAYGRYLELRQKGKLLTLSCSEAEWRGIWRQYFDWDTDYAAIKAAVDPADAYLQAACSLGGGVHILRQDLWEMIVSFIISQQNNIPRIKKCVESLCSLFGEKKINFRGESYSCFPDPQRLAGLTEDDLEPCHLGYRSSYILKTARMVTEGAVNLESLPELSYEEARKELMKLCGVGKKVADCICLFALHHVEAFPVDTHIQDMLDENYPQGFPFERYGGFAGILQQYAFYYELYGKQ